MTRKTCSAKASIALLLIGTIARVQAMTAVVFVLSIPLSTLCLPFADNRVLQRDIFLLLTCFDGVQKAYGTVDDAILSSRGRFFNPATNAVESTKFQFDSCHGTIFFRFGTGCFTTVRTWYDVPPKMIAVICQIGEVLWARLPTCKRCFVADQRSR